jgi:topoisomerase-4 subunit A
LPSKKCNYIKRFQIETLSTEQKFSFIADEPNAQLVFATTNQNPIVDYTIDLGKKKVSEKEQVNIAEFIEVKGWKAIGNKFIAGNLHTVELIVVEDNTAKDIPLEITNLNEGEQGDLFN